MLYVENVLHVDFRMIIEVNDADHNGHESIDNLRIVINNL